jgi:hypothetical protein
LTTSSSRSGSLFKVLVGKAFVILKKSEAASM